MAADDRDAVVHWDFTRSAPGVLGGALGRFGVLWRDRGGFLGTVMGWVAKRGCEGLRETEKSGRKLWRAGKRLGKAVKSCGMLGMTRKG